MRKLTGRDLAIISGIILHRYYVEGARVKQRIFTDSDHYGIILGRNPEGGYVTWQFYFNVNEELSVY